MKSILHIISLVVPDLKRPSSKLQEIIIGYIQKKNMKAAGKQNGLWALSMSESTVHVNQSLRSYHKLKPTQ